MSAASKVVLVALMVALLAGSALLEREVGRSRPSPDPAARRSELDLALQSQPEGLPVRPAAAGGPFRSAQRPLAESSPGLPAASAAARSPRQGNPDLRPGERTYVVRAGDTLAKIAKLAYGTNAAWKAILDRNRNVMGDPGKLRIGTILVLPALPEAGFRQGRR